MPIKFDFAVKYDPEKDTPQDVSRRILYSLVTARMKAKKPVIWFIGGDSGEGKSYTSLSLQQAILENQGLELEKYLDEINVFEPLQYPEKIERILNDKELKKINIITMHEARDIVRSKQWSSFLTQSVADINAQSRSIKRLCIFIISQFIRDITKDIRYTLTYYSTVVRPRDKKARITLNVIWKDDRDLESPKLRKRRVHGYLIHPNGKWQYFRPEYLELTQPPKEIRKKFNELDRKAKEEVIKDKLMKLIKELKSERIEKNPRVKNIIEYYNKNPDNITGLYKKYKGNVRVKQEVIDMYELNKTEVQNLNTGLQKLLTEKGVMDAKPEKLSEELRERSL